MSWLRRLSLMCLLIGVVAMMLPEELDAQRRGGSFGGSRRSYSTPRSAPRSAPRATPRSGRRSFGGSRGTERQSQRRSYDRRYDSRPTARTQRRPVTPQRENAFGGTRLQSSKAYTSQYGVPRKTEARSIPSSTGEARTYRMNQYGGMGDGFMMGYVMGTIPWYYSMPFHPAFYYSRPYTVVDKDGTTQVYPGTFQTGSLIFVVMLLAGGGYIIYVWRKVKRKRHLMGGVDVDMSKSSFG